MITNLKSETRPSRGRPRAFDPEAALAVGQRLFHAAGYDGVGLSALTEALGIKPPSFYMAFGSKAAFFERVLDRYARTEIPLADVLWGGRPTGEALADLLERAARTYARDPERPGCLVLEAARGSGESESVVMARRTAESRRAQVRAFVAATHPKIADVVTDFISTVMSGLSASAREGMGEARLLKVSRAAAESINVLLC
ncbi:TetR/AcrR family transcriptional regulator [Paraburkholderia sediminicola]|uniref:TetR/AcrR family transcriptional regulator n=1 Tax=Paraburkholderia sediminicola TaxID=458836 RepID=UPI0038BBE3B1